MKLKEKYMFIYLANLCKEFRILEELWQYIDNFIPDYYDDYKSGFENDEEK